MYLHFSDYGRHVGRSIIFQADRKSSEPCNSTARVCLCAKRREGHRIFHKYEYSKKFRWILLRDDRRCSARWIGKALSDSNIRSVGPIKVERMGRFKFYGGYIERSGLCERRIFDISVL